MSLQIDIVDMLKAKLKRMYYSQPSLRVAVAGSVVLNSRKLDFRLDGLTFS